LSLLYIVSYLGLGVPAVIGGVVVTEVNGLLATAQEYGAAVVVLAAVALAGLLAHRPMKAAAGVSMAPDAWASGAGSAGSGAWEVEGPVQEAGRVDSVDCGAGTKAV